MWSNSSSCQKLWRGGWRGRCCPNTYNQPEVFFKCKAHERIHTQMGHLLISQQQKGLIGGEGEEKRNKSEKEKKKFLQMDQLRQVVKNRGGEGGEVVVA